MNAPAWRDDTSYSRSEPKPRTPRVWLLNLGIVKVNVHRLYGCEGWYLSCYELGMDKRWLRAEDAEGARREALDVVLATAIKIADAVRSVTDG